MKIILVDNQDREEVADQLVVENVSDYWGKRIVTALNNISYKHSDEHFRLVEDDYALWRGMDELV